MLKPKLSATSLKVVDYVLLSGCLLALALKFYASVGRFLDPDERYCLHATFLISSRCDLYSTTHFFYPPLTWTFGAVLCKLGFGLYQTLLSLRIMSVTFSLLAFSLLFQVYRCLKVTYLIIPATLFAYFSTPLNLKIMEFRSDHPLILIVMCQFWLLTKAAINRKLTRSSALGILALAGAAFHTNQKALFIEPLLVAVMIGLWGWDWVKGSIRSSKFFVGLAIGIIILLTASSNYRSLIYNCYLYPLIVQISYDGQVTDYPMVSKLEFLIIAARYSVPLWILGFSNSVVIGLHLRRNRNLTIPLAYLTGALLILLLSRFPQIHYHIYWYWAVACALPWAAASMLTRYPRSGVIWFCLCSCLALTEPLKDYREEAVIKSLKAYAEMIDKVRTAIGRDRLASFNGNSLDIPSDLPFCDTAEQFKCDREYCYSDAIRNVLGEKNTQFILVEDDRRIRDSLNEIDGFFIQTNYLPVTGIPLLKAAKWLYVDAAHQSVEIPVGGTYRQATFSQTAATPDGLAVQDRATIITLLRGTVNFSVSEPTVVFIESEAGASTTEEHEFLAGAAVSFQPLSANFDNALTLIGILKSVKENQIRVRFFWRIEKQFSIELNAFHHLMNPQGSIAKTYNIDPGNGWYHFKNLLPGTIISYSVTLPQGSSPMKLAIGWYFKQSWTLRVRYADTDHLTVWL